MNIIQKISIIFSGLISGLINWYSNVANKSKAFLKKEIPFALMVGENIKAFLDSPAIPLLTALIPTGIDDMLVAKAKELLPRIMVELKMVHDQVDLSSNDAIIQAGLGYLKTTTKNDLKSKLISLTSILSSGLTDGKLSWAEAVSMGQSLWSKKFDKK